MSEQPGRYNVDFQIKPLSWSTFRKSASLKPFSSGLYVGPSPQEVYTLIDKMEWTHRDVANIVGVQFDEQKGRGSTTVKGWLRPTHSTANRKISYAAWRLMLVNAGLAKS